MLNIVAIISPVEILRLSIVEAQTAVLHFLPIHVGGKEAGYEVDRDGADDLRYSKQGNCEWERETYYSKF